MNHLKKRQSKKCKQRGIALIAVLFLLAILTFLAFTLSKDIRTEITLTSHQLKRAQALALAEEGIWRGAYKVLSRNQQAVAKNTVLMAGEIYPLTSKNGDLSIKLQSSSGLIDINQAHAGLLKSLLMSVGETSISADIITDSVLDWRDSDDEVRENGAEATDYLDASASVSPKNGLINSIDELAWINGVTPVVLEKLRPLITVYSNQPRVDIYTAPKPVLDAIPFLNDAITERIIEKRKQGDKRLPIEDIANESRQYIGSSDNQFIRISSLASVKGTVAGIIAVIKIEATSESPVTVVSWRQRIDKAFN